MMLVNVICLDGSTIQYHQTKRVYEFTVTKKGQDTSETKELQLVYDDKSGNLLGLAWEDKENTRPLDFIFQFIESKQFSSIVPMTITEYRKRMNDTRYLKVSKNKSNSYSIYLPSSWMNEFLDDDMRVETIYKGDCIVIKKPVKEIQSNIEETLIEEDIKGDSLIKDDFTIETQK